MTGFRMNLTLVVADHVKIEVSLWSAAFPSEDMPRMRSATFLEFIKAGNIQTIPIPWLLLPHQVDRLLSLACVISFALAMDAGSAFVSLLSYPPPISTRMLVQQPPYILYQGRSVWRITRRYFLLALSILYSVL
jgi:hypothetical protein